MKSKKRKYVLIFLALIVLILAVYLLILKINLIGNVISDFNLDDEVRLIRECDIYPSISKYNIDVEYSVRIVAPIGSFSELTDGPSWVSLGKNYWYGHWRAPQGAFLADGWIDESCFQRDIK